MAPRPRISTIPRPLTYLLAAVVIVGVAWALVLPAWHAPDESVHFAYVQSLVDRKRPPGDRSAPLASTEARLAYRYTQAADSRGDPTRKPEWRESAYQRWTERDRQLSETARRDGGGPNPARNNPPLYYAFESVPYLLASRGDVFDRLYAMRLWSVLCLAATTTFTWLLAGEFFGRNRALQLVCAAITGMQPMNSFISASLNPDGMLIATWVLELWLGVRLLHRGLSGARMAPLLAALALAVGTKAASYALVPAVAFVLGLGAVRKKSEYRRSVVLIACTFLTVGGAFALARASTLGTALSSLELTSVSFSDVRGFGSYLGQFYLAATPFVDHTAGTRPLAAYDTWIAQGWAAFAWSEVRFSPSVYAVLCVVVITGVLVGAIALMRRRPLDLAAIAFFAIAAAALLAGLHWVDYRIAIGDTVFSHTRAHIREIPLDGVAANPFLKGRYLLPLLPVCALVCGAGFTLLHSRARIMGIALLLALLATGQLLSLGIVVARFYA
jgi:hypothetical protein